MRCTVPAVVLLACLPLTACAAKTASGAAPAVTVTRTVPASTSPNPTTTTVSPTPTSPAPATTAVVVRTVAPPPARPHLTNASAVVSQYYQDITDHDYAAAWALGGSNIAGATYDHWVAGFDTTQSITLGTVSEFGASRVSAVLYATQTDGTVKVYDGTYTVSGGVLIGASVRQVG
ncbi:hypothetical protein ABT186_46950 [Streptomyces sp. NPDC001634]|uniref:hypothetical protein n=1 Tax=Streptomyces sp. NPDC001634 TaxID=3154390 RepID=UPI00332EBB59